MEFNENKDCNIDLAVSNLSLSDIREIGDGTEENPFLIADVEDFSKIRQNLESFYKLVDDIDFGGATLAAIGTPQTPFKGGLDGGGHAVKNFIISGKDHVGLFGYTRAAKIKDLGLETCEVTATGSYAGILTGYMYGGSIAGCYAEGTIKGENYTGGLVGYAWAEAVIRDSCTRAYVTNPTIYGGSLAGAGERMTIENCYAVCRFKKIIFGLLYRYKDVVVVNSYYDSQLAGRKSNDEYNIGRLTTAMIRKELYEGWDFETIWEIAEGESYPCHRKAGRILEKVIPEAVRLGIGTKEDPYLLENAQGMEGMEYDMRGYYRLSSDIDFEGKTVIPIGTANNPFKGVLDGNGHKIINFNINGTYSTGLFSYMQMAEIKNLGIENFEVTATANCTGALAGSMLGGSVTRCYAVGNVKGSGSTGCLIGETSNNAVIRDCYAKGSVTGSNTETGGLVGRPSSSKIENCYASCRMSANGSGLAGSAFSVKVISSYYDSQSMGFGGKNNALNTGKLTAAMIRKGLYKGWDFETIWDIAEGECYPYHRIFGRPTGIVDPGEVAFGIGTEESPYLLDSAMGINCITYDLEGCYRLTKDIDCADSLTKPIGTWEAPFMGYLDGDGHAVRNLKISGTEYVGLLGYIRSATIKNLGIVNAELIATGSYVGALTGYMDGGTVKECYAQGMISGNIFAGGLIGCAKSNALIQDSYARGSVTSSNSYQGGLAGYTDSGTIKNCYAACNMTGGEKGLVYVYGNKAVVSGSFYDIKAAGLGKEDKYNIGVV